MDAPKENKEFYASPRQRQVLLRLLTHPIIEQTFFLTGGTALAVFYLHHRVSDDLDFFTRTPASLSDLDSWIRGQWTGGCSKIKEGPNFLSFLIDETKVEFVIDPLSNSDQRASVEFENGKHLQVDNVRNIISNKLCAMVSRQEPKDFVDFYCLSKLYPAIDLDSIYQDARRKDAIFDDPPTAAFQLEEGLAFIRDNPNLLPKIRVEFDVTTFLGDLSRVAD
jgi:hypothetical protein